MSEVWTNSKIMLDLELLVQHLFQYYRPYETSHPDSFHSSPELPASISSSQMNLNTGFLKRSQ